MSGGSRLLCGISTLLDWPMNLKAMGNVGGKVAQLSRNNLVPRWPSRIEIASLRSQWPP
jgi:hypothetical protein